MKKMTFKIPALILALTMAYSTTSFAGVTRPCNYIGFKTVGQTHLILKNCGAALEITVQKGILQCELGTYEAVVVTHKIHGDKNAVPNGGYLTGRFVTYDGNGTQLEDRTYEGGYFVVNNYPFAGDIQKLRVEIQEFGSADIELNR